MKKRKTSTSGVQLLCTVLNSLLAVAAIVLAIVMLAQSGAVDPVTGLARAQRSGFLWAQIILLSVLCASGWAAHLLNARALLRPTLEMETHFAKIADGDLHTVCPLPEDSSEIGRLVASANLMQANYSHYIRTIENVLSGLAQGNLSVAIDQDFSGDFVRIRDALERIALSFGDSFAEINNASNEMSSGAEQISIGASALSEGSSEQAATIEELASTMSGVSQRVGETVNSAERVRASAVDMMAIIRKGNESLSLLSGMIERTGAYSNDIANIIKIIDNIAFQTNILALNAAVEAARAGENGAAFGVVADEVRTLANQTAENAKAVTRLIEDMLKSLADGVATAKTTEGSLEAIIDSADTVQQLVNRITLAMESDAAAVEESLAGLEQLSAVVQENSATAEESAAASEEIAAQAMAVKELVGKFKR